MLGDWASVLVYLLFAALIPAGLLFGSIVAGVKPRRAGRSKSMPFESGVSRGRFSPANFSINYYLVAMLFIVFDIEIVFLYPLAVNLELLGRVRLLGARGVRRHPGPRVRLRLAEGSARVAVTPGPAQPRRRVPGPRRRPARGRAPLAARDATSRTS